MKGPDWSNFQCFLVRMSGLPFVVRSAEREKCRQTPTSKSLTTHISPPSPQVKASPKLDFRAEIGWQRMKGKEKGQTFDRFGEWRYLTILRMRRTRPFGPTTERGERGNQSKCYQNFRSNISGERAGGKPSNKESGRRNKNTKKQKQNHPGSIILLCTLHQSTS